MYGCLAMSLKILSYTDHVFQHPDLAHIIFVRHRHRFQPRRTELYSPGLELE